MKLVSYGPPGGELPGVLDAGGSIVALAPALSRAGIDILDMNQLLAVWAAVEPVIERAVADPSSDRLPADSVRLGPPVPHPGKILAIGLNYPTHTGGSLGATTSESQPVVFMKTPNSLSGPNDTVVLPKQSTQVDYELELAVVIGRAGSHISRADAFDHVAGYMIANDVSARDVAFGPGLEYPMQLQIVRGKGFPTFCPTGPWPKRTGCQTRSHHVAPLTPGPTLPPTLTSDHPIAKDPAAASKSSRPRAVRQEVGSYT